MFHGPRPPAGYPDIVNCDVCKEPMPSSKIGQHFAEAHTDLDRQMRSYIKKIPWWILGSAGAFVLGVIAVWSLSPGLYEDNPLGFVTGAFIAVSVMACVEVLLLLNVLMWRKYQRLVAVWREEHPGWDRRTERGRH